MEASRDTALNIFLIQINSKQIQNKLRFQKWKLHYWSICFNVELRLVREVDLINWQARLNLQIEEKFENDFHIYLHENLAYYLDHDEWNSQSFWSASNLCNHILWNERGLLWLNLCLIITSWVLNHRYFFFFWGEVASI